MEFSLGQLNFRTGRALANPHQNPPPYPAAAQNQQANPAPAQNQEDNANAERVEDISVSIARWLKKVWDGWSGWTRGPVIFVVLWGIAFAFVYVFYMRHEPTSILFRPNYDERYSQVRKMQADQHIEQYRTNRLATTLDTARITRAPASYPTPPVVEDCCSVEPSATSTGGIITQSLPSATVPVSRNMQRINRQSEKWIKIRKSENIPDYCVGVITRIPKDEHEATIRANFLKTAVGSLLEGLHGCERNNTHLKLFVGAGDPTQHPELRMNWMQEFADDNMRYDLKRLTRAEQTMLKSGESETKEKYSLDYRHLLERCHEVGSKYVVIFEDDITAMDGWFHRMEQALEDVERKVKKRGRASFLYLRLFHSETMRGWKGRRREIASWVAIFFCGAIGVGLLGVGVRVAVLSYRRHRESGQIRIPEAQTPNMWKAFHIIFVLAFSGSSSMFFPMGRTPIRWLPHKVDERWPADVGAQGFVFPSHRIPDFIGRFQDNTGKWPWEVLDAYGDENHELRYVMTQSILQNNARKSADWHDGGYYSYYQEDKSKGLWNFGFEKYEQEKLWEEHEDHERKKGHGTSEDTPIEIQMGSVQNGA